MNTKPGYKTTEFWLSLATTFAGLLTHFAGTLPGPTGIVIGAAATAVYTISRGIAKS